MMGAWIAVAQLRGCSVRSYDRWHGRTRSVKPVYGVPAWRVPNEDGAQRPWFVGAPAHTRLTLHYGGYVVEALQ